MKVKKIFALLLAVVMVLGTMAIPAFAEDDLAWLDSVETPGSYDASGNLLKDWATLVADGDVRFGYQTTVGGEYQHGADGGHLTYVSRDITHIVIDGSVVHTIQGAFDSNTTIVGVKMTEGVKETSFKSFYKAANLRKVVFPESMETVGAKSFQQSGLESVVILEGVEYASNINSANTEVWAHFYACSNLKEVTIEDGVTTIPTEMFRECGFSSIIIPASVTHIGERSFERNNNLEEVYILSENFTMGDLAFRAVTSRDPVTVYTVNEAMQTLVAENQSASSDKTLSADTMVAVTENTDLSVAIDQIEAGDTLYFFNDVETLPDPKVPMTFKAVGDVKVTYRANISGSGIDGDIIYDGFTFDFAGDDLGEAFANWNSHSSLDLSKVNITIKNSKFINLEDGEAILIGSASNSVPQLNKLTVDNCTFDTLDTYAAGSSIITADNVKELVINNCTFNTTERVAHVAGNVQAVKMTNNTFNNAERALNLGMNLNAAPAAIEFAGNTVNNVETVIRMHKDVTNSNLGGQAIGSITLTDNDITTAENGVVIENQTSLLLQNIVDTATFTGNTVNDEEWTDVAQNTTGTQPVAKVNDTYYGTFAEAMTAVRTAAEADVSIEIYDAVTLTGSFPGNKNITVTGIGEDASMYIGSDMHSAPGSHLVFNDITIIRDNVDYKGFDDAITITFNRCTIKGQYFTYGITETFNNCTFEQDSAAKYNLWIYGTENAIFNTCTFNSAGKSVLVYNEGTFSPSASFESCTFNASQPVEGKAAIEIDSSLDKLGTGYNVSATNSTANGFAAGSESGNTLWNQKKGDAATVVIDGVQVEPLVEENITDKLILDLVAVDGTDNQWNVYVKADTGKVIYEFGSAELKFALECLENSKIGYTLEAAEGITITGVPGVQDAYYFNKKSGAALSSEIEILLGTITIDGYGKYVIKLDDSDVDGVSGIDYVHKVNTAKTNTHLMRTYTVGDSANELVLDTTKEQERLEKRSTINVTIDFSEPIKAGNAVAYNAMTVTLTGSNGEVYTGVIGSDADDNTADKKLYSDVNENKATFAFDVTAGYTYTAKVTAPGYRTVTYTTQTPCAADGVKNLYFWNDWRRNPFGSDVSPMAVIETDAEGNKVSTKELTNTFLAGDIVADDDMNIYDLSAVVAYAGTKINNSADYDYARYDLNRDSRIDSEDIDIVLNAWRGQQLAE